MGKLPSEKCLPTTSRRPVERRAMGIDLEAMWLFPLGGKVRHMAFKLIPGHNFPSLRKGPKGHVLLPPGGIQPRGNDMCPLSLCQAMIFFFFAKGRRITDG